MQEIGVWPGSLQSNSRETCIEYEKSQLTWFQSKTPVPWLISFKLVKGLLTFRGNALELTLYKRETNGDIQQK